MSTPSNTGSRPHPVPPMPGQHLSKPGREGEMALAPQYLAPDYQGSGKLAGMAAIVTGGDSGIGRAVSVLFAREGADIAIIYPNEHDDARETRCAVEAEGRRCLLIAGDVRESAFCNQAVAQAAQAFGRLDVLVNNAGQAVSQRFDRTDAALWQSMLAVNLTGTFHCIQAALPGMQERHFGRIVMMSSRGALGLPTRTAYSATKAGMVGMARTWSLELAPYGITVNVVAPGPIQTDMFYEVIEPGSEREKQLANGIPVKRLGRSDDVARAVMFFADPANSFVTGQTLFVCGGASVSSITI